jgi:hypothetical protein
MTGVTEGERITHRHLGRDRAQPCDRRARLIGPVNHPGTWSPRTLSSVESNARAANTLLKRQYG